MKRVTGDYSLCVDDVTVKVNGANILQDIRFTARSGDLLAILGPTGMRVVSPEPYSLIKIRYALEACYVFQSRFAVNSVPAESRVI